MKLDIMRMGTKSSGFIYTKKLEKHGTHDQSTHNPHKGGRGSLAGGTSYTPEEIMDIYADAMQREGGEWELSEGENTAVRDYVAQGHTMNGAVRRGETDFPSARAPLEETTANLDSAIAGAPPMKDMAVWRVANVRSVAGLKVGDVVRDKGYASTTIADLTKPENGIKLLTLNGVSSGRKTLVEINTGKSGKGLFIPAVGIGPVVEFEQEFLLPRDSMMEYLGTRTMLGGIQEIHQFKVVNG